MNNATATYSLRYVLSQVRAFNKLGNNNGIYLVHNTTTGLYFATFTPSLYTQSPYVYTRYTDCGSMALDLDYYTEHFRVESMYLDRQLCQLDDPLAYV